MAQNAEIFSALEAGDAGRLASLLEADPGIVEARNDAGDSPLLVAAYHKRRDLVDLLLRNGSEANLFEACVIGLAERVSGLLEEDPALARAYSHDGWTPLHLAAFFGQAEVVRLLLQRGAEVDARSRSQRFARSNTPLHAAAANGQVEAARLLLAGGADANARDGSGYSPLDLAGSARNDLLIILLLENGALAPGA